jgi:hypothetical protein
MPNPLRRFRKKYTNSAGNKGRNYLRGLGINDKIILGRTIKTRQCKYELD